MHGLLDLCLRGWDVQLILLAFASCWLSRWFYIRNAAIAPTLPTIRWLSTSIQGLFCLPTAMICAVWLSGLMISDQKAFTADKLSQWLFLALLAGCYAFLGSQLIKTSEFYERRNAVRLILACFLLCIVPAATWRLFEWWSFGNVHIFYHRIKAFGSGLSPLLSLAWLAAASTFWSAVEIDRHRVWRHHGSTWPANGDLSPELPGSAARTQRISRILDAPISRHHHQYLKTACIVVSTASILLLVKMQPVAESRAYGFLFVGLCASIGALAIFNFLRFLGVWRQLRELQEAAAETSLLAALVSMSDEIGWRPLQFISYKPSFALLRGTVARLGKLAGQTRSGHRLQPAMMDETLAAIVRNTAKGSLGERLAMRMELRDQLAVGYELAEWQPKGRVERELSALRLAAFLRGCMIQMRYLLLAATGCGLMVAVAEATYAFQPKRFTMLVVWGIMAAASMITIVVFVQINRDVTLSAIGGSKGGEINYDWHFASNLLAYGVLPLLGLITSQFPSMGRLVSSLLDPLARIVGIG